MIFMMCHSSMIHDNINISHLMVHDKYIEEARARRKSNDAKTARCFDGGSSKNRLEIHEILDLRSRFLIDSLSNFQRLVVIGCLTLNIRM